MRRGCDVEHVELFRQRLRHNSHVDKITRDEMLTHGHAGQLEASRLEIRDGR